MERCNRKELAEQLRGIEACAAQGHTAEQMMGMDAAAFASIIHQAACMVMEYPRPVISTNRVLTAEALLSIYSTDSAHDWPSNTPPYLYCEEKSGCGQWMSWRCVRDIIEGCDAGAVNMNTYFKTWRLWLCKPIEGEGKTVAWA